MVTLTAGGVQDGLPWDPGLCSRKGEHKHSGEAGCKVERLSAEHWNDRMWGRYQVLHRKARERAKRRVPGVRSCLLAKAPELQRRGVYHLHVLLGASTAAELAWSMAYVEALQELLAGSGFGAQFVVGHWAPARSAGGYVAKYVSKTEGVRKGWETGELPARAFYVSHRCTGRTGVTMRILKRRGRLWFEGLSVPINVFAVLREYEVALGRELTRRELLCLDGVGDRAPPV